MGRLAEDAGVRSSYLAGVISTVLLRDVYSTRKKRYGMVLPGKLRLIAINYK